MAKFFIGTLSAVTTFDLNIFLVDHTLHFITLITLFYQVHIRE